MTVVLVTHLVCAAAFAILAGLLLSGRERSRTANALAVACAITVIWAVAGAFVGPVPLSLVAVIESLRNLAWLLFLCTLLAPAGSTGVSWARTARLAVALTGGLAIGIDLLGVVLAPAATALSQPQLLARIGTAVLALSLVENHYRNTAPDARWHVIPLCIAIGAMYAFELFFCAEALLSHQVEPSLLAARALADAIAAPLLALAMVRTGNWRTDIRMSHEAAFHAVTLVSSGIFLFAMALVGVLFHRYGGEWGTILQITALFGSAVVLATVLSSETARSGIRMAILRNFFAYRYDYRVEWLRCIEALSSGEAVVALPERVIRAVADIVNSPGGVLFHVRDQAHEPTAFWNARVPAEVREPVDSPFIAGFRGGRWIQEIGARAPEPAPATRPSWLDGDDFWLAVPLPRQGELLGFVLLVAPRAAVHPDWEVFDLLRTVASQAAAYLFQQQAERSLADAQVLQEYSKRFAFVIHDIKNLSSQLGLILSNARRHGANPEFQADVLHTVENSVGRMNKLMSQLRVATVPALSSDEAPATDALSLVQEIAAGHPQAGRIDVICPLPSALVRMEPEPLRSVLCHLMDNALEASGTLGRVIVSLGESADRVTIDVSDEGPGMEVSFVRDELFRPFRSTKDSGFGIGAFQTRELIRAAGGQLDVITRPGAGTTMRITLHSSRGRSRVEPAA
jgi:putative PEP-CTERM system histidine kinase